MKRSRAHKTVDNWIYAATRHHTTTENARIEARISIKGYTSRHELGAEGMPTEAACVEISRSRRFGLLVRASVIDAPRGFDDMVFHPHEAHARYCAVERIVEALSWMGEDDWLEGDEE